MIKLIALDVDGVLTKNKYYDKDGNIIAKAFCDKDFTAIKMFKAAGVNVCFISGDDWNRGMAVKRNIDFFFSKPTDGVIDKALLLPEIMKKYNVQRNEIFYIGDDYYDLSIMNVLNNIAAPSDCNPYLRHKDNIWILPCKSGEGVVAELYDSLFERYNYPENYPKDDL